MRLRITVIIPTLNEEKKIAQTLENVLSQNPDDMIVVDGGSQDQTVPLTEAMHVKVVKSSQKGRAAQMNLGAEHAGGDILLFLHADTLLPSGGLGQVRQTVRSGARAGRFRIRFDASGVSLRFSEFCSRFQSFSYGDCAFFASREIFQRVGGFRTGVLLEDADFYRRVRQLTRPVILPASVTTSARRFSQKGVWRQRGINICLTFLNHLNLNNSNGKEKIYPDIR